MSDEKPKRTTVSELAKTLAERRSATTSYVNFKVSAQGAPQPEANITPETTWADVKEMTEMAKYAVSELMKEAWSHKPEWSAADKSTAARAAAIASRRTK